MPYKSNSELPETVKENLPEHGQNIFREAFKSLPNDGEKLQEWKPHIRLPGAQSREYTKKIREENG